MRFLRGARQVVATVALAGLIGVYPLATVLAVEEVTEISLTGVESVLDSATAGGGYEHGWKWVYHFTVPAGETLFKMRFSDFTSGSDTIPAAGNIRIFTPQSQSNTDESSAVLIAATLTYSDAVTLTGDTDSGTSGRQIDVTVEVQVPDGTPGGTYAATYDVESNIPPDTEAPVITLTGSDTIDLFVGGDYTEEGATAMDDVDDDISLNIVVSGDTVDTSVAGTYVVRYNVSDVAGNPALEVTRTVTVSAPPPPPECPPDCFEEM